MVRVLPNKPHQPLNFLFPKGEYAKKLWLSEFSSRHGSLNGNGYTNWKNKTPCYALRLLVQARRISFSVCYADTAFISRGFCNSKDVTGKSTIHASSKCYQEAVLMIVALLSMTADVAESLSIQHQRESLERLHCLLKVLDTSYEIIKLIKKSPCHDTILQQLRKQIREATAGIRVLCSTRWTDRAQVLHSIMTNYSVLQMV